jgi:hypothetical protein
MNQTSLLTKAAAWIGCIVALLVGAAMLFGHLSSSSVPGLTVNPSGSQSVGSLQTQTGSTMVDPWDWGAGIQVGAPSNAGPVLRMIAAGTCTLSVPTLPFVATTTTATTCSAGTIYNFRSTDMVVMDLAGAATSSYGVIAPIGPSFVSVSGQNPTLQTYLYNGTGASTSSFPIATTSAEFFVFRIL